MFARPIRRSRSAGPTRALELPHSDSVAVMTLHIRGNGRCELGDLDGMDDLWDALHRAETSGTALDMRTSYSYLSEWVGCTTDRSAVSR